MPMHRMSELIALSDGGVVRHTFYLDRMEATMLHIAILNAIGDAEEDSEEAKYLNRVYAKLNHYFFENSIRGGVNDIFFPMPQRKEKKVKKPKGKKSEQPKN